MKQKFILEYWQDDGWFVGKLKGVPGVFSQGRTLKELKENIKDAYHMMIKENDFTPRKKKRNVIQLSL